MQLRRPVRAVVADIDGTLLRPDGTLAAATVEALERLASTGTPVILATGRTPAGLHVVRPILPYIRLAVCCNGALGYEPTTQQVLWRDVFAAQQRRNLVESAHALLPLAGIGAYDGQRWLLTEHYYAARGAWPSGPYRVEHRREVGSLDACMLTVCDPDMHAGSVANALGPVAGRDNAPVLTYSTGALLDITPPGADKGTGVERALSAIDIDPDDAIAFGDAPSDVAMFRVIGRSFAVDDGYEEAKSAAANVVGSAAQDGVAVTLNEIGSVG